MNKKFEIKRCQTFMCASDGTKMQCPRMGYWRNINGKEYWLCERHLTTMLELPKLYLPKTRCEGLLKAIFGTWTSPINPRVQGEIRFQIRQLDIRQQHAIVSRFGLDRNEPCTRQQIGDLLGVTPERARQIEGKAIRKLRHHSRLGSLRKVQSAG